MGEEREKEMKKTILHADMNSCYVSIEQARHPELKGKAVAVGGSEKDRNGIILAKSIEAKAQGVKTGEVIWQAKGKCPNLMILPADFALYLTYSKLAHAIYREYTDRIEPFGIDECWLDVTESQKLFGNGDVIAEELRRRFREELDITISVGISDNKIFAKLGSDYKKPDAQTRIDLENYQKIAWPLPVEDLLYCGPRTRKKLHRMGVMTIGNLAKTDPSFIQKFLGVNGLRLWIAANGRDDTPVAREDFVPPIKSIGCGTTFRRDLRNDKEVKGGLIALAQELEKKLIEKKFSGKSLHLSVRDGLLAYQEAKMNLAYPVQNASELAESGFSLFCQTWTWKHPVRAMTLRVSDLFPEQTAVQRAFFPDFLRHEKKERLGKTIHELQKRYGPQSVQPAVMKDFHQADLLRPRATMPSNCFSALRKA